MVALIIGEFIMRLVLVALALSLGLTGPALARGKTLSAELQPLSFLVGRWAAPEGKTEQGTASGRSEFTIEAGGGALLRRDHTTLKTAEGRRAGSLGQVMLIYPEGGGLKADYSDGAHVIHYTKSEVQPGRSVTFSTVARDGAPSFRLTYALEPGDQVAVKFEMAPPGGSAFKTVAEGEMKRAVAKHRKGKKGEG